LKVPELVTESVLQEAAGAVEVVAPVVPVVPVLVLLLLPVEPALL
jgi:hypothetical protein